jgi:hypothetical protein
MDNVIVFRQWLDGSLNLINQFNSSTPLPRLSLIPCIVNYLFKGVSSQSSPSRPSLALTSIWMRSLVPVKMRP